MRPNFPVLAGACLLAITACGKGKAPEMPKPAPSLLVEMRAVTDDEFLLSDNSAVFTDTLTKVVRDTLEWKEVWNQAMRLRHADSKLPRPVIDFSKEMVALAAGGVMKPGDVIHIDSVGTRKDLTVIVIRYTIGCQNLRQSAYPFEMARLPRTTGEVTWREHRNKAPECQ